MFLPLYKLVSQTDFDFWFALLAVEQPIELTMLPSSPFEELSCSYWLFYSAMFFLFHSVTIIVRDTNILLLFYHEGVLDTSKILISEHNL